MALLLSQDVINRFRSDVDDLLRGPVDAPDNDALWKITDVSAYLADAVERVAAKTLVSFSTLAVPVTANEAVCRLSSSYTVLDITHAYLVNARRYLDPKNVDGGMSARGDTDFRDYDMQGLWATEHWETRTGTPLYYLRDEQQNALRLVPIPTADDTLQITASIIPAFVVGAPLPFSSFEDQHLVLLWMKKLAYSKHDADTFDPERAKRAEDEFEARLIDRKYDAQRVRRTAQPVRFSW